MTSPTHTTESSIPGIQTFSATWPVLDLDKLNSELKAEALSDLDEILRSKYLTAVRDPECDVREVHGQWWFIVSVKVIPMTLTQRRLEQVRRQKQSDCPHASTVTAHDLEGNQVFEKCADCGLHDTADQSLKEMAS